MAGARAGISPGWSRRPLPMVQAHARGAVVGFLRSGAWAESVVVPTNALAALPDAVTFAQAATLPVAGLTALYALTKRGLLLHRRVCITGATGGVGDFAIQLAHLAGAQVIAQVRRPDQVAVVKQIGADDVVIGEDPAAFTQHAPYDLVLESVGGSAWRRHWPPWLKMGCVSLGNSASHEVTCDIRQFRQTGRTTLYGFILFEELALEPAAVGLAHLAGLIAAGKLKPTISVEAPGRRLAR